MFGPIPSTRSERWEWIDRFVRTWSGGDQQSAGISERRLDDAERRLGINLPLGLRAWYSLLGGYSTFWSAQDRFLPPELLELVGTKLVFFVECQSVVQWYIRLSGTKSLDPAVWVDLDELGEGNFQESDSLSAFAVAMAIYAAKFSAEFRVTANTGPARLAERLISAGAHRVSTTDWHWPKYPTKLLLLDETVIEIYGPSGDDCWIEASAATRQGIDAVSAVLEKCGVKLRKA